jgi:hypothetical protein
MHRSHAYAELARELEVWRAFPVQELVARIGLSTVTKFVQVQNEMLVLELTAQWEDAKKTAVRISGIARGPSHWRLERVEEKTIVQIEHLSGE